MLSALDTASKPPGLPASRLPNFNNMSVHLIDPVNNPRWDEFVYNHPFGYVYHHSSWKKVLEQSFGHMKGYYFILTDDGSGTINSALPIYQVRSWLLGNRLVSIPFASICDPLISTPCDLKRLMMSVNKLRRSLNCSSIEIRTLNSSSLFPTEQFGISNYYQYHYLLLNNDLETIKKNFHRKTVRQSINRAMKSDIRIKTGEKKNDLLAFYKLIADTRKNNGLPLIPFQFFENLWYFLHPSKIVNLLLATFNGKVIAGLLYFKFKDRVSLEYSGWNREYSKLCPNHLLYWEALKKAHQDGIKIFDFGRTSSINDDLLKFKERWGTTKLDMPYLFRPHIKAQKILNLETSIKYGIVHEFSKKLPSTLQKIFGKFCYSHLG